MITLSMACGHTLTVPHDIDAAPMCPTCGERRVQHVTARAPRFRGVAQGPHVTYESLPAIPVTIGVPHA